VLQFISGVLVYSDIPPFLKVIASVPAEVDGAGAAPGVLAGLGGGGRLRRSWQTEWVVVMLVAWFIGSLVFARLTFRWDRSS
jgi:hypothetical protein